ncbi:MAG: hypothetical protein HY769_08295, partial [Candidatus Stahlbacteria bacterium]|nr:hypothetical protein [Candidatus Stahlbacteria bacterium]
VNLGIYDITGRLVRTIYSGVQEAGNYEVNVGADPCVCPKTNGEHIGSPLQAGIYFIKLDTGGYKVTEKLTILK